MQGKHPVGFLKPVPTRVRYVDKIFCFSFSGFLLVYVLCANVLGQDKNWTRLLGAKRSYHDGIFKILISNYPDFKRSFELEHELQKSFVNRDNMRFNFIFNNDPSRIRRNGGIERFMNFEWRDLDEQKLINSNPSYAEMIKKIKNLQKDISSDPNRAGAQQVLLHVKAFAEHKKLVKELNLVIAQVQKDLAEYE